MVISFDGAGAGAGAGAGFDGDWFDGALRGWVGCDGVEGGFDGVGS